MNAKKGFGNLLLTVGAVLLALFFISDYGQIPNGWYLLLGVILFSIGVYLAWTGRTKPKPADRYRTARRMFGKNKGKGKDQDEESGDED